jgi:hypothetical protein
MKKWATILVIVITVMFSYIASAKVVINEFVVDPQQDWNNNSYLTSSDEWIELYNNDLTPADLTGWTLALNDTSPEIESLSVIIPPDSYHVIINPMDEQNNNGMLILYDPYGNAIDSVTYGNYNDSNLLDNAQDGNAIDVFDECLARFPNAADTGIDSDDFKKQQCTFGLTNSPPTIEIGNLSVVDCVFEYSNVTLTADVSYFGMTLSNVLFEMKINEANKNKTAIKGAKDSYSVKLFPSDLVPGQNVSWRVLARDNLGNLYNSSWERFYVRGKTNLVITPGNPDGQTGFYLSKPFFSFTKDPLAGTIVYRWNGDSSQPYFGTFTIKDSDNKTGGLLTLRWSADFDECGTEAERSQTIRLDFIEPSISSLIPEKNSVTYNRKPLISALISDLFQSNSGINESSIRLYLDNSLIANPNITKLNAITAQVSYNPISNLSFGVHEVRVSASDNAGRSSSSNWFFEISEIDGFSLHVFYPKTGFYTDNRVPFNISTDEEVAEITYIDALDTKNSDTLCKDCNSFGNDRRKAKYFKDGQHNIIIRAIDYFDNAVEKSVFFILDTKVPQITKTEPKRGFASGTFEIDFREENPTSLILYYGNSTLQKATSLDISENCVRNSPKFECKITVPLNEFDRHEIFYSAKLTDYANNSIFSREYMLKVDTTPPKLNNPNPEDFMYISGRYVTFLFNVEDANFDEIEYIDSFDRTPREKNLCSRLKEGICLKKISFKEGEHNLTISFKDKAGNEFRLEDVHFVILYTAI